MTDFEASFNFENRDPIKLDAVIEPRQEVEAQFAININGDDKTYVYEQTISSDTWEITHNLNKRPSITVVDSADNVVIGAYTYLDANKVLLRFNSAFIGKAYFN